MWMLTKNAANTSQTSQLFFLVCMFYFSFSEKYTHSHSFVFYCTCTSGTKCVSIISKCIKQSTPTAMLHFWVVIYSALTKPHARTRRWLTRFRNASVTSWEKDVKVCTSRGRWLEWCTPPPPWRPRSGPWRWGWGGTLASGSREPPRWSAGLLRRHHRHHSRSVPVSDRKAAVRVLLLSTIVLVDPIRRLDEQRLGGVRVRFLPYPGLLGFHIELADLIDKQVRKKKVNFLKMFASQIVCN